MPLFPAAQLAAWSGGRWTTLPAAPLTGFTFDSRQARGGDVFVALKTDKRDGHDFVAAALAAGAAAALVATPLPALALPQLVVADPLRAFHAIAREHRRSFRGPVIGISGSAGKTSTKDLLSVLLGGATSGVVATEGNLNNHIGVPLTLTRLDPAAHRFAVIEAGISAPGEMDVLAAMIEPDVAILTLVAPAHTEELGGIDGVAREKSRLAVATRRGGLAIFPESVARYPAFQQLTVPRLVVTPVTRLDAGSADAVPFDVEHHEDETRVSLAFRGARFEFRFRRVTDGMAQNAVLAIAAALHLGVGASDIQARFAEWKPGKLRGEMRRIDGRLFYVDCYNANPASMHDALATFETIAPANEPRLFVLGCMEELGAESARYHRTLGRSLRLRPNDRLFVIGTHAADVCAGVLERGDFTAQLQIVSTLEPVTAALADWRGAVFVKGSRRYQLEKILELQTSLPLPC